MIPRPVNFTVGLLCYNTVQETLAALVPLVEECARLVAAGGINVDLVVRDNGMDGTGHKVYHHLVSQPLPFRHLSIDWDGKNLGQGGGRNSILQRCPEADYILFLDSEIHVVPQSLKFMLEYMVDHPSTGCFNPHPVRQTRNPGAATKEMTGIEFLLNDIRSACTGYALYRGEVFRQGIRFEDQGPFAGPGWGLEDDDMYLQLTTAGWKVEYFVGIIYLQRKARSSWEHIQKEGVNVLQRFEERKAYFLEKWKTKGVSPAILLNVKGQDLRGLRA